MPDSKQRKMQQVYNEADCLHSEAQVAACIERLAEDISQQLNEQNPLILTVMNGGLVFSGQLLTKMTFPLEIDYVHATRYGDKVVGETLNWIAKPGTDMEGRTVLILDDILDVGTTLLDIIDYCHRQGAANVLTAVLVDKQHERKARKDFKADFTGIKVEDRFIFGYGMDYKGYWRNAPGIYAVKGL